jgi:hypothetical protein
MLHRKGKGKQPLQIDTYIGWLIGMGVSPVILYLLIWSCWSSVLIGFFLAVKLSVSPIYIATELCQDNIKTWVLSLCS